MVIEDISYNKTVLNARDKYLPSHLDRLFAAVIDFLIFSPFVSLFTSGILSDFKMNALLSDFSNQYSLLFQYVFTVFVLFVSYESLFIYFIAATPGHYFLYQRIESSNLDDGQLSLIRIFFRSIFKFFSFVFLLTPFLEILVNKERRPFYDRITSTRLISLKSISANDELMPAFKDLIQRVSYFVVSFVFVMIGTFFYQMTSSNLFLNSKDHEETMVNGKAVKCNKNLDQYLVQMIDNDVEQAAQECAKKLSYHDSNKYYFYRFVIENDRVLKLKYLEKICMSHEVSFFCNSNHLQTATENESGKLVTTASNKQEIDSYKSEDFVYYYYQLHQALLEKDAELAMLLFDKIYDDIVWTDKLENQYIKTFLTLEQSQSRKPATSSEKKMKLNYINFKKRLGV